MTLPRFTESLLKGEPPVGWIFETMSAAVSRAEYGLSDPVCEDGNLGIVGMKQMQGGRIDASDLQRISVEADEIEDLLLRNGDLLFNRTNSLDLVGKAAIYESDTPATFASYLVRLHLKKEIIDPWFLFYWLCSNTARIACKRIATRAVGQANINPSEFRRVFPLPLPASLGEQERITRVLRTWDRAIDVCVALIESSLRQKKALAQQLLTGKRRFPGFSDDWKHTHLGDVCERVTRKNEVEINNVLTISAQHGLVSQQDYFNKPVASSDLSKYAHLKRGDFAYNKSYSKGFPMGAIKELSLYDEGVVSSLYICFRRKRHGLGEQAFLRHFFESGMLNREIYAFAQEGARNHGLLNIAVGDFFNCRLNLPSRDEQLAIAAALDLADQCVEGHKKQLELLEKEKRALMQQLLTGKRRVKLPPEHTTPAKEPAS